MRILINAVSAVAGGGMTYLVNLLKYLPDLMNEDEFLVVIQGIDLPQEIYNKKNLEIKKISDSTSSQNLIKRFWWENTGLIKICKLWKADVLYCIANMTPIVLAPIPTIVMIQNIAPLTPKVLFRLFCYEGIKPFLKMFFNSLLTLYASFISKKVLVLSEDSHKILKLMIPNNKIFVVHHGISKDFKQTIDKPETIGNEPYFVFVSNIYVYKGLEYIVEAYKHNNQLPHIFVIGQPFDINYYNHIKQQIEENNLNHKIIFVNSIPYQELPKWYSNAIANVFPTWCESFGCGIIESQACGCPVVGMKVATLPEFCAIPDLLTNNINAKELAEKMEKAIEMKKDTKIHYRLYEFCKKFTWENTMRLHKEVFYK